METVTAPLHTYQFNLDNYQQMIEAGILVGDKVELIRGEILTMTPMGNDHIFSILSFNQRLTATYAQEALVLVQCPIQIPPNSEPEPDFALLRLPIERYKTQKPQPKDILLIIEVSDSTLAYDRDKKSSLYAEANIPEFWIKNLSEHILEVYRQPERGKYRVHLVNFADDLITPLFSERAFKWSDSD